MKWHLYRDSTRQWRWRLVARNGRILADSGESYEQQLYAKAALDRCRHAWNAPVVNDEEG